MPTRREFMRGCCAAASMGVFTSFSRFGLLNALAAAPTDYKALVCIFLFGGNDGNNLIVPITDTPTAGFRYSDYFAIRADQTNGGLALTQAQLLPVTAKTAQPSGARDFGFHPALAQIRGLFQQNRVAVVANVGALVEPITRTEYLNKTKQRPDNLFSHSDQQQQWQTAELTGFGTTGWAGRTADKIRTIYDVGQTYPPITTLRARLSSAPATRRNLLPWRPQRTPPPSACRDTALRLRSLTRAWPPCRKCSRSIRAFR